MKGLQDEEIAVALRGSKNVTFFTSDAGFYRELQHHNYCLVVIMVAQQDAAAFIRRFLRHPDFNTSRKRMGRIVRLTPAGIVSRRVPGEREIRIDWKP